MNFSVSKRVVLIILDGWGHREEKEYNAIAQAETPFFDYLWRRYPRTLLHASGGKVGLPEGQIGNSEVGHMTLGAGSTLDTDLVRISKDIASGNLHKNPVLEKLFQHVKKYNSTLHVMGLLSPGGVHSHMDHLVSFLEAAKKVDIHKIAIHAFLDGRDTPPQSGVKFLSDLENVLETLGIGFIASASGRFYAMDRDKHWERIQKAEDAIFHGKAPSYKNIKPSELLKKLYAKNIVDEHVEPIIFADSTGKHYSVERNDGIFFFNFRADRAKQLSKRVREYKKKMNIHFATLTEYEKGVEDSQAAYGPIFPKTTLAHEISKVGLKQVHIAETEKFAHVTSFFNGGREQKHALEEHVLIESRRDIATHDLAPKMRAKEISDAALMQIESDTPFILMNYANADMVGHTASVPAIIEAVEEVDRELKRVVQAALENKFQVIVTADHGNAEVNFDETTNSKHTAHTTSPVPCIIVSESIILRGDGGLSDIAPTILDLMDLPKPDTMTGKSLKKKK